MPPASNEYRDIESGRGHSGRAKRTSSRGNSPNNNYYQKHPPTIVHHSDNSTHQMDGSVRSNGSGRAGKMIKKKMSRFLKSSFHRSNHKKGTAGEQEAILSYQNVDIKNAGTFDSSASATVESASAVSLEHPKSQARMVQKWGKLKDSLQTKSWIERLNTAQRLALVNANSHANDHQDHSKMVKEAQDKIRNMMEISLLQCIIAIVVYVAGSVYCFSYWLEDWTITDSIYFAIVTFTTIGYGDVVPDTRMSRIFTCFWALSGVACLGIALGVLGSQLVETAEKEKKEAHKQHREGVIGMFNTDDGIPSTCNDSTVSGWSELGDSGVEDQMNPRAQFDGIQDNNFDDDEGEDSYCRSCFCSPKTKRFFLLSTFVVAILFLMSMTEGWNIWSTFYYGIITACTVGYGDLSPQTQRGRILAIMYIPIAVGVMGTLLDVVANSIIDRQRQNAQSYLKSKELTLQDLAVMDSDGDGQVTRAEFLEFMLVAMNQVDQNLMDNLREHFDRLDSDHSGTLDKSDLINVAQHNLHKERSSRRMREAV